jgi:hypothetical protein
MSIILMICFARSGGTVLNQCLGCLPNTIILSEVNPIGGGSGKEEISCSTVKSQASQWYGIDLKSNNFAEGLLELKDICIEKQKHLIVRDWSFANFTPLRQNNWQPSYTLLTLEVLQKETHVKPFAFVRDAIDVWISRGMPECNNFFNSYLKYVKAIIENQIPIFKYEDFCQNPQETIESICNKTGLEYKDVINDYQNFDKVNGDIQILSRGRRQNSIKPLYRKNIKRDKIQKLHECPAMMEANQLLAYPTSYYSVPRENLFLKGIKATPKLIRRLWN